MKRDTNFSMVRVSACLAPPPPLSSSSSSLSAPSLLFPPVRLSAPTAPDPADPADPADPPPAVAAAPAAPRAWRPKRSLIKGTVGATDPGSRVYQTVMLAGTDAVGARTAQGDLTKRATRCRPGVLELGEGFAKDILEVQANKRKALSKKLKEANAAVRELGVVSNDDKRYFTRLRRMKNEAAVRLENLKHDGRVRVAANIFSRLETVLWPHFQTQQMVKRGSFLSQANKQRLLSLCHGKLRVFMRHRATVLGKHLRIVNEHYTTQVCPRCMRRNKLVGSREVFKCPFNRCGYK